MSRVDNPCNLDSAGLAPADFINPTIVPQVYIDVLQRSITRIYGCIRVPIASSNWFCATNATEKESLGRITQCKTNLVETNCSVPLPKLVESINVLIDGCVLDNSNAAFYCQPNASTKISCTLAASSTTSKNSLNIAIPIVVTVAALGLLSLGAFLWFRGRRKNQSETLSPKISTNTSSLNLNPGRNLRTTPLTPPSNVGPPIYAVELGYPPVSPSSGPPPFPKGVSTSVSAAVGEQRPTHVVERVRKNTDASMNEILLGPNESIGERREELKLPSSAQLSHDPSISPSPPNNISLVAPRSVVSFDTSLPSLDASAPVPMSSEMYSAPEVHPMELFPRPYRTFVNIAGKAPDGPERDGAVPHLHTSIVSLPRQLSYSPSKELCQCYALDWKLPLSAQYTSSYAKDLVKSKIHLPDYSIPHLTATFAGFQQTLNDIVDASFQYAQRSNQPSLATKVFQTITGVTPNPEWGSLPNQYAFISRVLTTLVSDVYVALTSPMKIDSHVSFLKSTMTELKEELKRQPTAQLLFCGFDQLLTVNPSLVLNHLHPLLAHANNSITSLFNSHGLAPPDKETLDHWLQAIMDWLIRMKREFPTVAIYSPTVRSPLSPLVTVEGGNGHRVAFVTGLGLWDLSVGQPGYLAKVWAKS